MSPRDRGAVQNRELAREKTMDILIAHPLPEDVLAWLRSRHTVLHDPRIAEDPQRLQAVLPLIRAAFLPPQLVLDEARLAQAPRLRVIGRIEDAAHEDIERPACARLGVEVVLGLAAHARSEAEFLLGALITLTRPGAEPPAGPPGRELGSLTVGLIGVSHTASILANLLGAFRTKVLGYDPSLHANDASWGAWGIEPCGLREMVQQADAICVQLGDHSRYRGLLGERQFSVCRPGQIWVSVGSGRLFDVHALAAALRRGHLQAAWLDDVEAAACRPGGALHGLDSLIVTPRLAGFTREARQRRAWLVARQTHELLRLLPQGVRDFGTTVPADLLESNAFGSYGRWNRAALAAPQPVVTPTLEATPPDPGLSPDAGAANGSAPASH